MSEASLGGNVGAGAAPAATRQLRREVGFIGLLFASLGSIIGSGWLLGALTAAGAAGPASLISWVMAGVVVIVLALIHAELGATYPLAGGTARFPHYAFGSLAGFTAGWMAFLGAVTVAPIEVEAALTYMTNIKPLAWLTHLSGGVPVLTTPGYVVAAALMLLFTIINILGVRRLATANSAAVWWKIAVPILAIVVFIAIAFHPSNFTSAKGGFMPFGWKGVVQALPLGVVFALLGFEQAIQLGGEAKNPRQHLAAAVILSILIGTAIYLLLEVAFIGALNPADIAKGGWAKPIAKGDFGPYAGIATALGLTWLAVILYIDAFISPAGTGLIYTGASSRLSYALSRNGYVPAFFERLSDRGVPVLSIVFVFLVGLLMFLPFPGWQKLVGFITSATALMYAFAPLALASLRRQEPDRPRPYSVFAGPVIAPIGFILANLIFYWGGWAVNSKLLIAVALGFVLLGISYVTNLNPHKPDLDLKAVAWLGPYLVGMGLISWLSTFDGIGKIPFGWEDTALVAVFSLVIYFLAMSFRLEPQHVRNYVDSVTTEEMVPEAPPAGGAERAPTGRPVVG